MLPVIASLTGTLVSATLLLALIPIWQMKGAVIGLVGGFWVSGIFSLLWYNAASLSLLTGGLSCYEPCGQGA